MYKKTPSILSVNKKQPKKNKERVVLYFVSSEGWKQFEKALKKHYTTIK